MADRPRGARDFYPERFDLGDMCEASRRCRGCDLYRRATQTVFGEGDPHARVMLVGEEPGDEEDVAGRPFVGPAGRLMDGLMERAGLDRSKAWVTNAVKHFKWEPRGVRRLHVRPTMLEVHACRPWLDAEIELVAPEVVVLLGATAAASLLGPKFRLTHERGVPQPLPNGACAFATWHPSAALRAVTHEDRERVRGEIVEDLRRAARELRTHAESRHGR